MTNFKSGDLVENKSNGNIEMVDYTCEGILYGHFKPVDHKGLALIPMPIYKIISPRSVKFNLSKTNKSK